MIKVKRSETEKKLPVKPQMREPVHSQNLVQNPKPFLSAKGQTQRQQEVREMLLAGDWTGCLMWLRYRKKSGSCPDLCVAYTGTDEKANMIKAVRLFSRQVTLPLVIDSTNLEVIEEALKCYGGKAIINSINLEDGKKRLIRSAALQRDTAPFL